MSAFFGMRGSGDWATNEELENYRQGIMRLYPNGRLPLTAITSMMPSSKVRSRHFHWWTQTLPSMGGTLTGIYSDVAMATPYVSGGVEGSIVYVKVTKAIAEEFRKGLNVLLRCTTDPYLDTVGCVINVVKDATYGRIDVRLSEADDNGTSPNTLADANYIEIFSSSQPEGSPMPDAIAFNPVEISNRMQIFENSLDLARTAMNIDLRTEDAYTKTKRDALEYHGFLMEKTWLHGICGTRIGDNGKPEGNAGGFKWFMKTYCPANIVDYSLDNTYAGKKWIESGEDWMDKYLEVVFRYGTDEKLALCGSGALLGLQKLAKANASMQFHPGESIGYGMKLTAWDTSFGTIMLKTHPLMSANPIDRYSIFIMEPKNMLEYVYVDDTFFKPDLGYKKGGANSIDGKAESWLSEASMRFYHPEKGMIMHSVGKDNLLGS